MRPRAASPADEEWPEEPKPPRLTPDEELPTERPELERLVHVDAARPEWMRVGRPVEIAAAAMLVVGRRRAVLRALAPVGEAILARRVDVAARVVAAAAAAERRDTDQHERHAARALRSFLQHGASPRRRQSSSVLT
jgi:hypothetical protein